MYSKQNEASTKVIENVEEYIDFRHLFFTFWENKVLILMITFIVVGLASTYLLFKKPLYEANTLIKIENANRGSFSSLSQQLNLPTQDSNIVTAQIAIIKSRVILDPVVKELGLAISITPHQHFKLFNKWFRRDAGDSLTIKNLQVPEEYYDKALMLITTHSSHYQLFDPKGTLLFEGRLGQLENNHKGLTIEVTEMPSQSGKSFDVIKHSDISVIKKLLSQLKIDELGDGTNNQTGILQIDLKDTNSTRLVNVLNAIAKKTQENDAKRRSLETTKTLQFLTQQVPLIKSSLEKSETLLNRYQIANGKLDTLYESKQLIQELSNIDRKVTLVKLKKADLLQKFTEKHPFIIAINQKIKQLEKLKSLIIQQKKSFSSSDQIAANLTRDVKVKNNLYLLILKKIQELRIIKAGTLSNIRILAKAIPPDAPLPKQSSSIILASFILGFILGCSTILMRKVFFNSVIDPHWIENNLNLINLAIVPFSKSQNRNFNSKQGAHGDLLAEKFPRDFSVEALRSLRMSFLIRIPKNNNKIVTILGITPGVGKSFISANFSYLLADIGKRVLVIDGDMRKGNLHEYFHTSRSPGLSEVLSQNINFEKIIKKISNVDLYFLSCGEYPSNPAALFMSDQFQHFLANASKQFDIIVIDTSPLLAVGDSLIISSCAGLNLLVIGSDKHQPEQIRYAIKCLKNSKIEIHGTIFNNLKAEAALFKNYRYNYSYYEYNQASKKL